MLSLLQLTEIQSVAAHLAKEFNKISPTDETKKISFLDVGLVEVQGPGKGKKVFYTVEDLLFDYKLKFTKWSNNTGTHDMVKSQLFMMFICHIFFLFIQATGVNFVRFGTNTYSA